MCLAHGMRPALCVDPIRNDAREARERMRFADWLYARADQGARIFLQGDARPEEGGTPRAGPRSAAGGARRLPARAASRLQLAREGMARGIHVLQSSGITPVGFVPRGWQGSAEIRLAAREEGLTLLEDTRFLWRLADELPIAAPLVRWIGFARRGATGFAGHSGVGGHIRERATLLRVVLRPADAGDAATMALLSKVLDRWRRDDVVCGYDALTDGWPRAQRTAA